MPQRFRRGKRIGYVTATTGTGGAAGFSLAFAKDLDVTPAGRRSEVASLAARAMTGDAVAFGQLMSMEQARVLRIARYLLGEPDEARDAAQEVFLKAHRSLRRYDPSREWGPWIYRITVNVCRDLQRRRRLRSILSLDSMTDAGAPEPVSTETAPDERADAARRREMLVRALRRLSAKERAAVVLRDIEGLSASEVARALGSSEATVRSQASRARAKLRDILERIRRGE